VIDMGRNTQTRAGRTDACAFPSDRLPNRERDAERRAEASVTAVTASDVASGEA